MCVVLRARDGLGPMLRLRFRSRPFPVMLLLKEIVTTGPSVLLQLHIEVEVWWKST
jgi:hypothetical protein